MKCKEEVNAIKYSCNCGKINEIRPLKNGANEMPAFCDSCVSVKAKPAFIKDEEIPYTFDEARGDLASFVSSNNPRDCFIQDMYTQALIILKKLEKEYSND